MKEVKRYGGWNGNVQYLVIFNEENRRKGNILKGKIPRADKHESIAPRITMHPM